MGRPKLYPEQIRLPLPEGTTDRIDAVLGEFEPRLDMLRAAIEREIERRTALGMIRSVEKKAVERPQRQPEPAFVVSEPRIVDPDPNWFPDNEEREHQEASEERTNFTYYSPAPGDRKPRKMARSIVQEKYGGDLATAIRAAIAMDHGKS